MKTRKRRREPDRASAWQGLIVHALLSWKARLIRLVRGAPPPLRPVAAGERAEPHFDRLGRVASPRMAPEEMRTKRKKRTTNRHRRPRRAAARPPAARPRAAPAAAMCRPRSICSRRKRASERTTLSKELIDANATALETVLGDFGVRGEIINARPGPVVTLYELEPAPGIKSSRVIGLADDIARSMSAVSARVAVVSGRNAIGIELPNPTREKVYLRELLAGKDYNETAAKLPLCLGKTIGGESVIVDLSRMPHLLIAGTTGSGKSVAINTMILSLVYRLSPRPVPADHGRSEDARAFRL